MSKEIGNERICLVPHSVSCHLYFKTSWAKHLHPLPQLLVWRMEEYLKLKQDGENEDIMSELMDILKSWIDFFLMKMLVNHKDVYSNYKSRHLVSLEKLKCILCKVFVYKKECLVHM